MESPIVSRQQLFALTATLLLSLPAGYEPDHFAKALFIGAAMQSAAYALILMWVTHRSSTLQNAVLALLYLLFFIETFTYACFGSRLNPAIVTLILQTSWQETAEFARVFLLTPKSLLCIAVGMALPLAYRWLWQRCSTDSWPRRWPGKVLATAVAAGGVALWLNILPFPLGMNTLNEAMHSCLFVAESHRDIETMTAMIDRISIRQPADSAETPPTIVLVIGESFDKHHSSLYGYPLSTSPHLKAERDSGSLTIFTHAETPTNGTAFAMRYLFTQKGCEDSDHDSLACIVMPAVFKKAGWTVTYIDNQYTRASGGELDYSCGYFLNPQYINSHSFDYRNTTRSPYDADFIAEQSSHLQRHPRSLNIIHLMGQHFDARQRFPDTFARFTATDIHRPGLSKQQRQQVADYDNATLYNDHSLWTILNLFRKSDAVVVCLSDHGELVYEGADRLFGRSFASVQDTTALKHVFQIPLMIWCSDSYQQRHAQTCERIRQAAHRHVCLADVPFLLYDLAGISFNYDQPHRSCISPAFRPHPVKKK